ncbi:MBL fold metallo-hydrolase [Bacillus rubiinfantis]|uniref:MBL fold metallo-hydrolase n=1 Tax=Bacillus rubiinfantis TaxID=1499680 RepID=UPI0005A97CE7|nr:MBL fold metallo-hydrolase [Bacillus rubiinfantis]
MIQKICDEVYQVKIPIPYDFGTVNSYLIEGKNGFTVVDTGDYTDAAIAVWGNVLGDGKFPIERVVLTHAHTDHIGLAGWFQQQYNVPVLMADKSYEDMQKLRSNFHDGHYHDPHASFLEKHGWRIEANGADEFHRFQAYQFEPDELFSDGEKVLLGDRHYQAIWTPGHSPDHFCFYNKQTQTLVVGDHILHAINPIVICTGEGQNPLRDYLLAMEKLRICDAKTILPGHGENFFDLPTRIEIMMAHYRKRWKQMVGAIAVAGSTALQVTELVYGKNLPPERAGAAFYQSITNLVFLESCGVLQRKEIDEKVYFEKRAGKEYTKYLVD